MPLQLLKVFAELEEQVALSCAQHLALVPCMALPTEGLSRTWDCPVHALWWGTVSITLSSWQELNSEMRQHQEDLATLEHLAEELSSCGFAPSTFQQQEKLQSLKKDFLQLQKVAIDR